MLTDLPANDGTVAPAEKNQPSGIQDWGPNNERLPDELKACLWEIMSAMEQEDDLPRRSEMRAIVQRRLFFRGEQYYWWNGGGGNGGLWFPPYENAPGQSNQEPPAFQHVTNIFQSNGLVSSAILTQNTVPARFWPQSAKDPIDVATAKNASKVAELIHRNNDMESKNQDAAYYLWTDPMIGAYVRFVSDGERFGYETEDIQEAQDQVISPDALTCTGCATQYPVETESPVCPQCGEPLEFQPAVTGQVPMTVGQVEIPQGQEVISVIGSLNIRRSMWADRQDQFLYLTWVDDLHKATAKAHYPHVAADIDASSGDSTASDGFEKLLRRLLYLGYGRHTGSENTNLGTFRRTWLRPRAFYSLQVDCVADKAPSCTCKRCQLLAIYPHGAEVIWFNDVYCESRDGSMDTKWATMLSMPGEGQNRETLGSALIPVQEQLNDAVNLIFETAMFGVPEGFADSKMIDWEARATQTASPAQLTPVKLSANQRVQDKLMYSQAIEPGQAIVEFRNELMTTIPQLISGLAPALFGGDTGGNDTASGIAIERNQALGRIGRAWRLMQEFWSKTDLLAVQCFARNRSKDVEVAVLGDGGKWKPDYLKLEELKGNITAYPEVDRQYPVLQAQISALYTSMITSPPNPLSIALMSDPDNMETIVDKTGMTDMVVPGQDQRAKTHNVIEKLLDESPIMGPSAEGMPPQPVPSVVPDELIDNLQVALDTTEKWMRSEAGQTAQTENPNGFLNVYLYAKACQQLGLQAEMKKALAAGAMQGQGPASDLGGAEDVQPPPEQQPAAQ